MSTVVSPLKGGIGAGSEQNFASMSMMVSALKGGIGAGANQNFVPMSMVVSPSGGIGIGTNRVHG